MSGGVSVRGLYEELTRNFYVYPFRELDVTDLAQRRVEITGED